MKPLSTKIKESTILLLAGLVALFINSFRLLELFGLVVTANSEFTKATIGDWILHFFFFAFFSWLALKFNLEWLDALINNIKNKAKKIMKPFLWVIFNSSIVAVFHITFIPLYKFLFGIEISQQEQSTQTFGWVIVLLVLLFIAFILKLQLRSKNDAIEKEQLKQEKIKSELVAIKNQVNPHFLFNSLNTLNSIIRKNPEKATDFVDKLSFMYRYILQSSEKGLVTLAEELEFLNTYVYLINMRYGNRFEIINTLTINANKTKIPVLSLQLLVENAVKHNVITSENPLRIDILEKDGFLVITNNLNKKSILEKGTKVGLNNIIERYGLITKKNVEVIISEGNFIVKLPLLTQKIKEMRTNINEESRYFRARKQVKELKEFYGSLVSYVIVMPFLIFIWYRYTSNTIQWFWFPMLGWGFGLVVQGLKVFGYNALFGNNWEERKIQELMDEDKKQYWE